MVFAEGLPVLFVQNKMRIDDARLMAAYLGSIQTGV